MSLSCTKCLSLLNPSTPVEWMKCPKCGAELSIELFPVISQKSYDKTLVLSTLNADETRCFYHPDKNAIVSCSGCGRFLCALCDVELNQKHLCPLCIEAGKRKGKIQTLENQRILYDNIALFLSIVPIIFLLPTLITAPLAIIISVKYWNSPLSIIPRTRFRYILAIGVAGMQIIGWFFLFINIFLGISL